MHALKLTSTKRTDLLSILRELPDPRVERTRLHKFEDILVIAICALLCGAESFEDMELFGDTKEPWLRTFLELPNGIPSYDTFNRLFAALDSAALSGCVHALDAKPAHRAGRRGCRHRRQGAAPRGRQEQRIERSEIANGRSLCPKGSAGAAMPV